MQSNITWKYLYPFIKLWNKACFYIYTYRYVCIGITFLMRDYASEQRKNMQTNTFKTAKIYCQKMDGTENILKSILFSLLFQNVIFHFSLFC